MKIMLLTSILDAHLSKEQNIEERVPGAFRICFSQPPSDWRKVFYHKTLCSKLPTERQAFCKVLLLHLGAGGICR